MAVLEEPFAQLNGACTVLKVWHAIHIVIFERAQLQQYQLEEIGQQASWLTQQSRSDNQSSQPHLPAPSRFRKGYVVGAGTTASGWHHRDSIYYV